MKRIKIASSNLKGIGYDKEKKIMEVEFNQGGIYQYKEVLENDYNDIMHSASKGGALHRLRKERNWAYEKMNN